MKVSIITVTYNCKLDLIETIKSVQKQSYKNFEHIIIDGQSSDGTVEIIENYSENYKNVKFISEKDNGIYDAMNKGIRLCEGSIIFFLNAKDIFFNNDVLNNIVNMFKAEKIDILYGNVVTVNKKNIIVKKHNYKLKKQVKMKGICHQSIFFKSDIFNEIIGFDCRYKISSDYDLIVRAFNNKYEFKYYDLNIVCYDENGVSSNVNNHKVAINEYRKIIKSNFRLNQRILPNIRYLYMMMKFFINKRIKSEYHEK